MAGISPSEEPLSRPRPRRGRPPKRGSDMGRDFHRARQADYRYSKKAKTSVTTEDFFQDLSYEPLPAYNEYTAEFVLRLKEESKIATDTLPGVNLLQDDGQLRLALDNKFRLIAGNFVTTHDWDLQQQIATWQQGGGSIEGDAVLPYKSQFTTKVTLDEIQSIFSIDPPRHLQSANLLNVDNNTGLSFHPACFQDYSLLHKIDRSRQTSISRGSSNILDHGWLLMASGPTSSSWHVDYMGLATYVLVLEGTKIWHVPDGSPRQLTREFERLGTLGTAYTDGIIRCPLSKGHFIFQGPGTPHAVVTPGQAMAAGYFLYTSATFGNSIRSIRDQLLRRTITNDEPNAQDWDNVKSVVEHIDKEGIFAPEHRPDVYQAIYELLCDLGCIIRRGEDDGWQSNTQWKSATQKLLQKCIKAEDVRERALGFVEHCLKLWLSKYH